MEELELIVDGYVFGNEEDAKRAGEESQRVTLLKVKIDYADLAAVHSVYEKAIANHVFITPIGISFLRELRDQLADSEYAAELSAIPVPTICVDMTKDETAEGSEDAELSELARLRVRSDSLSERLERTKKSQKRVSDSLRMSKLLNVALVVIVILLFVITLTGENANALNYKRVLEDKYASWEEELTQRENALRQQENNQSVNQEEGAENGTD